MVDADELVRRGVPERVADELAAFQREFEGALESPDWMHAPNGQAEWLAARLALCAERVRAAVRPGRSKWQRGIHYEVVR